MKQKLKEICRKYEDPQELDNQYIALYENRIKKIDGFRSLSIYL
jgi:hypothetical protein